MSPQDTSPPSARQPSLTPAAGEMRDRIDTYDWASTPLGDVAGWPASLRTIVDMLVSSGLPMVLLWGPQGVLIYNDGYAAFAGAKHPRILGMPALEAWPEIADWNAARIADGLAGRGSTWPAQHMALERAGVVDDVWLDLTYSPVLDESGRPAGTLVVFVEVTARVLLNRQLAAERDALRRTFQRAPGFQATLRGPNHVFEMANEAYLALVGHRDLFGRPVAEALPEVVGQGFVQLMDHVYQTGEPYVGHSASVSLRRHASAPVETRYVDFIYQPIRGDGGQVEGVFVQGHDVTERQRAFAALAESEQRFRLIADSAPSPMWVSELGGRRQFVNRAYLEFLQLPYEEGLNFDWRALLHPDDLQRIGRESMQGEASLKQFAMEARYRRHDGRWRWLRSISQPRWGPSGEHAGFVGLAFDITEQMSAAEHQRLLINELNHRVKNTLATVQSLAAQTFRAGVDPDDARKRFQSRLQALSKAHDVLTRESWESAPLREIVDQALRPYRDALPSDRVQASGPDLQLAPRVALALSMTLHELATNAAKHGALSDDRGRVRLSWTASASAAPCDLTLTWTEEGGPPVRPPERRSFGTRLVERQLAHELGGHAQFDFRPEGLVCTLHAPLASPSAAA